MFKIVGVIVPLVMTSCVTPRMGETSMKIDEIYSQSQDRLRSQLVLTDCDPERGYLDRSCGYMVTKDSWQEFQKTKCDHCGIAYNQYVQNELPLKYKYALSEAVLPEFNNQKYREEWCRLRSVRAKDAYEYINCNLGYLEQLYRLSHNIGIKERISSLEDSKQEALKRAELIDRVDANERWNAVSRAVSSAMSGGASAASERGLYRGNLNGNSYDPNSVSNPYGRYGSKYSPESINNPYGAGSPYSNKKFNLYDSSGNYRGRISNDPSDPDSVNNPYGRYGNPSNLNGQGLEIYEENK